MAASRLQTELLALEPTDKSDEHSQILESYLKPIIARNSYQLSADSSRMPLPRPTAQSRFLIGQKSQPVSLADANNQFRVLSASLVSRAEQAVKMYIDLDRAVELQKLSNELDQWYNNSLSLRAASRSDSSREFDLLSIRYHIHRIAISCAPYNNECIYDKHLSDYKAVVKLCADFLNPHDQAPLSHVVRSHDTSTSMALTTVGSSCRDPEVRREAIRLLYMYPRLEGIWQSAMMGFSAEMTMISEEQGLTVHSCQDIPPERRERTVQMVYNPGYLDDDK